MAFDQRLADRVRVALRRVPSVAATTKEIRMFGGLCFMVRGHMCCGVIGDDLVVRIGAARYREALVQPHARPMDFTSRPLAGFIYVAPAGWRRPADLSTWIRRALAFAGSLPAKKTARRRGARSRPSRASARS
jgi:hypothetical protein